MQKQMCIVYTYVPQVQTMHISNLVLTIGVLHDNQYLKDLRTSRLMHRAPCNDNKVQDLFRNMHKS